MATILISARMRSNCCSIHSFLEIFTANYERMYLVSTDIGLGTNTFFEVAALFDNASQSVRVRKLSAVITIVAF